jgi:hypothetical protein
MNFLMLPMKADTDAAEKQLTAWKQKVQEDYGITIDLNADDTKALAKVTSFVAKFQKGTEEVNKVIDFGQGILAEYPEIFGEINESTTKTIDLLQEGATQTASWAANGASYGALLGPMGAAIGGIVGGIAGAAKATYDWYKEEEKANAVALDIAEVWGTVEGYVSDAWAAVKEFAQQSYDASIAVYRLAGGLAELDRISVQLAPTTQELLDTYQRAEQAFADAQADVAMGLATQEEANELFEAATAAKKAYVEALDRETSSLNTNTTAKKENNKEEDAYLKYQREKAELSAQAVANFNKAVEKERQEANAQEQKDFAAQQAELRKIADESYREYMAKKKAAEDEERRATEESHKAMVASYESFFGEIFGFFGDLTSHIERNIAAEKRALDGVGIAIQRSIGERLKARGKEWGAIASAELGAAFAALATPGAQGLAAPHFASAAKYGSAAAFAGIAGVVTAGNAAARESRESSSSNSPGSGSNTSSSIGGGSGRTTDPGPTQHGAVTIYYGGGPGSTNLYTGTSEDAKAQAGMIVDDWREAAANAGPTLKRRG